MRFIQKAKITNNRKYNWFLLSVDRSLHWKSYHLICLIDFFSQVRTRVKRKERVYLCNGCNRVDNTLRNFDNMVQWEKRSSRTKLLHFKYLIGVSSRICTVRETCELLKNWYFEWTLVVQLISQRRSYTNKFNFYFVVVVSLPSKIELTLMYVGVFLFYFTHARARCWNSFGIDF